MRLLDRYLLRELLVPLTYCIVGFLVFWISFTLISDLSKFQEAHLTARDILQYYILVTPEQLTVVLPVALLLGLLYSLTTHARHHELTAIRAAGIGLWRFSLPYLVVGTLFSLFLFALNELWVPASAEKAELLRNRQGGKREWVANVNFKNARENRSWRIGSYNLVTAEMVNPMIIWERPDGSRREIYAERATYTDRTWTFYAVNESVSRPGEFAQLMQTNLLVLDGLSETPDLIRSEITINNLNPVQAAKRAQISIREIQRFLSLHPVLTATQRSLIETQLQGRLADPWRCLVVVLIAIPFGAPSGRRNVFVGVASSIFICFAYFICFRLGLTLGTAGTVPPVVAAWAPNCLFSAAGILLTSRVR